MRSTIYHTRIRSTMAPLKLLKLVVLLVLRQCSWFPLDLLFLSSLACGFVVSYKTFPRYLLAHFHHKNLTNHICISIFFTNSMNIVVKLLVISKNWVTCITDGSANTTSQKFLLFSSIFSTHIWWCL